MSSGPPRPLTAEGTTRARRILDAVGAHMTAVARTVRTTGYLAGVAAGAVLATYGPPYTGAYWLMGMFLAAGSLLAIIGTLWGRWAFELTGLPLVASALIQLAVLTIRDGPHGWVIVPSVGILAAFGILMLARWIDLFILARATARAHARDTPPVAP